MSETPNTPKVTVDSEGRTVINAPDLAAVVKEIQSTGGQQDLFGLNIICPVTNSTAHCGAVVAEQE